MNVFSLRWQQALAQLPQHAWRERMVVQRVWQGKRQIAQHSLVDFSSNDYLGLANELSLQSAWQKAVLHFGVGSGASQVVSGYSQPQAELEQALAQWLGLARAVIYPSGYLANVDLLCTILNKSDRVWIDKLTHASLFDGVRYSGAKFTRFAHHDVMMLERLCCKVSDEACARLIITDGVFSMEGSIAPIAKLAGIARAQLALLLIDDAHGLGVLGPCGEGVIASLADRADVILTGTLSKAFGGMGGFVAGSEVTIEYLLQHSRGLRYATAMPAGLMQASLQALDFIQHKPWRREKLFENIRLWQQTAALQGLQLMPSTTPIQCVLVGCPTKVLQLGNALRARGFLVGVMRSPTVPKGSERLRISLSAVHERKQIMELVKTMVQLQKVL